MFLLHLFHVLFPFAKLGADQAKVAEQLKVWLEALENIVKIIFDFFVSGNYGKGLWGDSNYDDKIRLKNM